MTKAIFHVQLCVELRADDATRSCAEIWHDAGCDLESERKILRMKINEQQKKKRSQELTGSSGGEVTFRVNDRAGQEQRETTDQQSRRITISETPNQRSLTRSERHRRGQRGHTHRASSGNAARKG